MLKIPPEKSSEEKSNPRANRYKAMHETRIGCTKLICSDNKSLSSGTARNIFGRFSPQWIHAWASTLISILQRGQGFALRFRSGVFSIAVPISPSSNPIILHDNNYIMFMIRFVRITEIGIYLSQIDHDTHRMHIYAHLS